MEPLLFIILLLAIFILSCLTFLIGVFTYEQFLDFKDKLEYREKNKNKE